MNGPQEKAVAAIERILGTPISKLRHTSHGSVSVLVVYHDPVQCAFTVSNGGTLELYTDEPVHVRA